MPSMRSLIFCWGNCQPFMSTDFSNFALPAVKMRTRCQTSVIWSGCCFSSMGRTVTSR